MIWHVEPVGLVDGQYYRCEAFLDGEAKGFLSINRLLIDQQGDARFDIEALHLARSCIARSEGKRAWHDVESERVRPLADMIAAAWRTVWEAQQ